MGVVWVKWVWSGHNQCGPGVSGCGLGEVGVVWV